MIFLKEKELFVDRKRHEYGVYCRGTASAVVLFYDGVGSTRYSQDLMLLSINTLTVNVYCLRSYFNLGLSLFPRNNLIFLGPSLKKVSWDTLHSMIEEIVFAVLSFNISQQ